MANKCPVLGLVHADCPHSRKHKQCLLQSVGVGCFHSAFCYSSTKFAQSTECGSDGIKTEVYRTEQVVMPHHKPM